MKLSSLFAICCSACWLGSVAAQEAASYLDTAQGWGPYALSAHSLPPSLKEAMPAEQQHSRRYRGVSTPEAIREQNRRPSDPDTWLPATPPRMMPYLDSLFVPGNTCAEPCAFVDDDGLSTAAQKLKKELSAVGFQYNLNLTYDYARTAHAERGQKRDFSSFNCNMTGKWFLVKDALHRHAFFLSCEADWGKGTNFNENSAGAKNSLGSVSNPQGCLRGGNGVFIPELALGATLCEGRYVAMVGTIDASNYLDQNAYSADWNGNLINQSFNYNPCLPLLWSNWGYLTAWQPCESFYMMACTTGSNAPINHNSMRYISAKHLVHNGELGYICKDLCGLGAGTYRLQYTYTHEENTAGHGVAFNIQQQLGRSSQLGFFTRCGFSDNDAAAITGCRTAVTGGLVLQAPFSSSGWGSRANNDQLALGFLWQKAPNDDGARVHRGEMGLELSAVVQLTPTLFLQPDVQYIHHPAYSTGRDNAWVLQLQSVWRF